MSASPVRVSSAPDFRACDRSEAKGIEVGDMAGETSVE
jgi:hypothetical protein